MFQRDGLETHRDESRRLWNWVGPGKRGGRHSGRVETECFPRRGGGGGGES